MSSGTPGIRFCFMTFCIIFVPSPQKWNRERGRLSAPPLFSRPNIWRSQSLAELLAPFRRMALRPQKVKKTVTCIPMAAAPVAMMNAAIARSMSPLNSTMVTLSGLEACKSANATAGSICAIVMTPSFLSDPHECGDFNAVLTIVSASFSCQGKGGRGTARPSFLLAEVARSECAPSMRTVKDSLAAPLRVKWEKSGGSRLGYWHVQGHRLRSSRRVWKVGKLHAEGDRADQPAMGSTGSWQKGSKIQSCGA